MSFVAQLHFGVGSFAVIAGFLALFVIKGSSIHKISGKIFTISMVVLCLSGFYMSWARDLQFTFLLSAFSIYLAVTGWLSIRKKSVEFTMSDKIGLFYIALFCLICFGLSIIGSSLNWRYPETEPPYEAYAVIGTCAALFLLGDIKYLKRNQLRKELRIKRHITRICSSMLIATIVFFFGNNHVLPDAWRTLPLLSLPIIVVLVFMLVYRFGFKKLLGSR